MNTNSYHFLSFFQEVFELGASASFKQSTHWSEFEEVQTNAPLIQVLVLNEYHNLKLSNLEWGAATDSGSDTHKSDNVPVLAKSTPWAITALF